MYLVYSDVYPICICSTATDAEEMCLALAEASYYENCYMRQQLGFSIHQSLAKFATFYNYKEVPFVG